MQGVDGFDDLEVAAVAVFLAQSAGLHGALQVAAGDVLRVGQHILTGDHPSAHGVSQVPQRAGKVRVITRHRPALGDEFPQQIVTFNQWRDVVLVN